MGEFGGTEAIWSALARFGTPLFRTALNAFVSRPSARSFLRKARKRSGRRGTAQRQQRRQSCQAVLHGLKATIEKAK